MAQVKIIKKKFHKFKNNSYLCKANNKTQNNMDVIISELNFMQSPKEGDKLAKIFDALELEWEQLDTDNSHIIVTTRLSLVDALQLKQTAEMACAK